MTYISRTENHLLMTQALLSLKGNWGLAFIAALIYTMITIVSQSIPFLGSVIALLITGAMNLGWCAFVLSIARDEELRLEDMFSGFQRFWTAFRTHILFMLFVILWSVLLIIPGILAALSYSQAFFILADDEDCEALEAISRSKEMMVGNRWKFFCLLLRFVGWILVCILTFGIGFLLLIPYMTVSFAHFYEELAFEADLPDAFTAPAPPDKGDIIEKIIEQVMAIDQTIKDKQKLKSEIESTIAGLENSVDLSKEEIEKIAAEVLEEEYKKS